MSNLKEVYTETILHMLLPVRQYLDDPDISEIMINGHKEIYIESFGQLKPVTATFADEFSLEAAARNIAQYVGKRLTQDLLSIEARLPDGSRVHIVQNPVSSKGLCMSIRKFSKHKLDLDVLVAKGSISAMAAEFLGVCTELAKNIIVSGGTGSGKTTLLNCLSAMVPETERIIVIEDSSELQLQQEHVVPFEVKPADRHGRGGIDIRELFRASLRMRPDRIIVGECRGGEALDMIQAMTSGHGGSMSTCHANSPQGALSRIETMALMGGIEIPLYALRSQITSAIDLIVQINRFHDGSRKITHISEVLPLTKEGTYEVADIFNLNVSKHKELSWTGIKPTFFQEVQSCETLTKIELTKSLWSGG